MFHIIKAVTKGMVHRIFTSGYCRQECEKNTSQMFLHAIFTVGYESSSLHRLLPIWSSGWYLRKNRVNVGLSPVRFLTGNNVREI